MANTTGGAGQNSAQASAGATTGGNETFGGRIKRLRLAKNLNGKALAKAADISAQAVYNYETGKHKASMATKQALAGVLGTEVWGDETPPVAAQASPIAKPPAQKQNAAKASGSRASGSGGAAKIGGNSGRATTKTTGGGKNIAYAATTGDAGDPWRTLMAARDAFCSRTGLPKAAVEISIKYS